MLKVKHNDLLIRLAAISQKHDIQNNITKSWIYKEKCVVIDFVYKNINFAFDFVFNKSNISIYLESRGSSIVFMATGSYQKKIILERDVLLENLEKDYLSIYNKIIDLIDYEYKFKVSVIVPVHNRENIIHKCINSLNNQTMDKSLFEVIFVDDNSTDNSISMIEGLVTEGLSYSILKRPVGSGSACAPRNDGLKFSKGQYVLFLDSDDYLSDFCLSKAVEYAEMNQSDLVYLRIGIDTEYPRSIPTRAFKNGSVGRADIIDHHLLRSNSMCKLYNRFFLLINNLLLDQSIAVGEDKLFGIQALSSTDKVSILADDYYIYITKHEEGHLSRKPRALHEDKKLYLNGFNSIFISKFDFDYKNKLYNSWMILVIERVRSVLRSSHYSQQEKYDFFHQLFSYVNYSPYFINKKYIYKNLHVLLESVLYRDFYRFTSFLAN